MSIVYESTEDRVLFKKYIELMSKYELREKDYYPSGFYYIIKGYSFEKIAAMSVAKDGEVAIGVSIKFNDTSMHGCNITCYVKREYRKRGIGSELVNMIASKKLISMGAHQFPIGFPRDKSNRDNKSI